MKKKLIVIDDKPDDVISFRGIIRKWGLDYNVVSNDGLPKPDNDSDEARNAFTSNIIEMVTANLENTEAILLDVLFEHGDQGPEGEIPLGYYIGKQLRRQFPQIPIILFTIRGEQQDIKDATYFFSFDGYLTKSEFRKSRDASFFEAELYRARRKRDAVIEEFSELQQQLSSRTLDVLDEFIDPVILHISDIHYGIETTVSDGPDAYGNMLETLKRDILENYKNEGIPHPNLVIVSGDITSKGSIKGYPLAKSFLLDLCNALENRITNDRIVLVPGNHDMSRRLSRMACGLSPFDETEESEGNPDEHYIYRFAPFKQFFDDFYDGGHVYQLRASKMFSIFDYSSTYRLVIVGFNSCEKIDHSLKWRNYPNISLDTIQTAKQALRDEGLDSPDLIKIAVWHHPQLIEEANDPSYHSELLSELAKEGFLLYLHGHIHKPFNNFQPDLYRGQGLFEFGAGTVGAGATERPPDWPKHYEILAFDMTKRKCTVFSRQKIGNNWLPFSSFKNTKSTYEFDLP